MTIGGGKNDDWRGKEGLEEREGVGEKKGMKRNEKSAI